MKKLFFTMMGALLLASTACDDIKNGEQENTRTMRGTLPTCVIFEDENQPAVLTADASYAFTYFTNRGVWNVTVNNLKVGNMAGELTFTTPDIAPSGTYNLLLSYMSPIAAKTGQTVSGFSGILSNNYYYYTGESTVELSQLGTLITIAFSVPGQYSVRAFPQRCYFGGTTVSSYKDSEGNEKHYENKTAQFGIDMDVAAGTATMTIHNAQFAEEMPAISRMELRGLKLEADREHGYKISGKDITPIVGEGAAAVPFPAFAFDEIEFNPTNTLMTLGECDFEVAGRYKGEFTGSFVK